MNPALLKKDKLYQELRQGIVSGRYAPGSRLPKELEFSRMLGVAKVTLRSALERLEAEKLIVRLPRKGTFVSGEPTPNLILIVYNGNNVTADFPHHYIIPGICAAASELGFQTEQCFVEYLRNLEVDDALNILHRKNLRGVLVVASNWNGDEQELKILHALQCPVIIVHGDQNDVQLGFPMILPNTRQAWSAGLEFLARKGRKNLRILMKKHTTRAWDAEELEILCRRLGFRISGNLIYEAELTPESIAEAGTAMLSVSTKPDVIYCYSDFFAIELMRFLKQRDVRIPEDIMVMGYCGYPGDMFLDTPLSTVDLGFDYTGRSAVRTLLSLPWEKSADFFLMETPYRIIERESTLVKQSHNKKQRMEAV